MLVIICGVRGVGCNKRLALRGYNWTGWYIIMQVKCALLLSEHTKFILYVGNVCGVRGVRF
jgi:predicted membrane-bound dolichyl-phosphate-mannose-protein mannosyltransferase